MKRVQVGFLAFAALMLALVLAVQAATKSYQFTGTVKSVDGATFSVEKSAKETWVFETTKDTKGTPKVGDKVTVQYKMVATDIEKKTEKETEKKTGKKPGK